MVNETIMQLDLHGLFKDNGTIDYDSDYEYKEDCITESFSQFMIVFVLILYSIVLVFGFLGNGFVLVVLCQKKLTWSVTNVFLLHLAITDLLLLFTMLLWAVDAAKGWILGTGLCKLAGALFKISFYCGVFLLTCISLDHCFAFKHRLVVKLRLVHLSCLAVWILSFLLSIPDWMYLESNQGDNTECLHWYPSRASRLTSRLFHHVLGFLLPVIGLVYCSICVLRQCSQDIQKGGLQKQKAAYVILTLVLAFLISWTPYNIALLVDTVKPKSTVPCIDRRWSVVKITAIFGFVHSCCNPIIYFLFSEKFRQYVLDIMRCKFHAVGSGDYFPWDCGIVNHSSGAQEEKGALNPITELNQMYTRQQKNDIL